MARRGVYYTTGVGGRVIHGPERGGGNPYRARWDPSSGGGARGSPAPAAAQNRLRIRALSRLTFHKENVNPCAHLRSVSQDQRPTTWALRKGPSCITGLLHKIGGERRRANR